eukprot:TRINITY_DN15646_c0_g1_i1.p1 TRINITY_DN15646_c0_g1~~TRINITY_DN15646_c0_g1_i1.p1  ORF type:complete len:417 (-),score=99.93 TRINITY_DN15646_c0_g1_i1:77-1240(-)
MFAKSFAGLVVQGSRRSTGVLLNNGRMGLMGNTTNSIIPSPFFSGGSLSKAFGSLSISSNNLQNNGTSSSMKGTYATRMLDNSSSLFESRRSIYGDVYTDLDEIESLTLQQKHALVRKRELLDVLDNSTDFDAQRAAYEELVDLQREHQELLCAPGKDIFGQLLTAREKIIQEQNTEGSEKLSYNLEPYLKDRKPLSDQIIVRETIKIGRHVKTRDGIRIQSFSALVVIGTGNGAAAYGYGKASTAMMAIQKANLDAEKHMVVVDLWEDRTIPNDIDCWFEGTQLRFRTGKEGRGVTAAPLLRTLCEAFGLKDVAVKILGRRNKQMIIRCFFKAMLMFTHPETRARRLGQQLFDHSKVWRNRNPIYTYGQLDNVLKRLPNKPDDAWL